ncbi:putative lipoprotein [Ochrobactrum sp. BH3]|nr:putative lipoprotein [Ochrobactrum sp. BH3]
MSTQANQVSQKPARLNRAVLWSVVAAVVVVGAIGFDTKVVKIGSEADVRQQVFSPEAYGAAEFPKVKASVEERAAEAVEVGTALVADKDAAGKKYGVGSVNPVIPVKFTGTVEERKSNYNIIKVDGFPEGMTIRVQTGPAVNGTDLRDATGTIEFGQFKNQIEFQNAGSALNNEMKKQVLEGVDVNNLVGKTVSVTGVFKLVNPKNWLVTPVGLEVK